MLLLWYLRFKLPLLIAVAGVSVMMLENILLITQLRYAPIPHPYRQHLCYHLRPYGFLTARTFGAMQYTAASVNVATGVLLLFGAVREKTSSGRAILGLCAVFMFMWLPFIYLATRGWPSGGADVDLDHVRTLVLAYMDPATTLQTLRANFLSFTALPRTFFLLIVPVLVIVSRVKMCSKGQSRIVSAPTGSVVQIWFYVVALTGSAAMLSIGGYLPWVLGTRWSITAIAGIALSILGLVALAHDDLIQILGLLHV